MEQVKQAGLMGGMVLIWVITLPLQVISLIIVIQTGAFILGLAGWGVVALLVFGIPITLAAAVVDEANIRRNPPSKKPYAEMTDDEVLEHWPKSMRAAEINHARFQASLLPQPPYGTDEPDGWDIIIGGKD